MASTRELEDTIPLTSPITHNGDFKDRKIAIYTTLSNETSQLQQLEQDLRDADDISDEDVAELAPQPHFNSMLDIYNHHVDLAKQDTLQHDPSYFIVADQEDWKENGVLFVNLTADTEQREFFVGVCRCNLETATQIKANLEIANMDWVDYKEMEQEEFDGENPYKNSRYYPVDPTASGG
ncbi:hypothetical protein Q7P35_003515 [Cladosporium inversicolor]